jgi:probable phosphoglycerate mutase
MELIFLRHAQPGWVADGRPVLDPPLTELGRRQAEVVAERIASFGAITEVVVSPTRRTRETAAPLCTALGVEPSVADWLEEIRLPDWRQEPAEAVEQVYRQARKRPLSEWWDGLPGGETFRDFHRRITGGLAGALAARGIEQRAGDAPHLWRVDDEGQRILWVGHGGSNAVALGWLLGLEPVPWEWERFVSRHASVARVKAVPMAGGHIFGLRCFSDVGHLPADLHTR